MGQTGKKEWGWLNYSLKTKERNSKALNVWSNAFQTIKDGISS